MTFIAKAFHLLRCESQLITCLENTTWILPAAPIREKTKPSTSIREATIMWVAHVPCGFCTPTSTAAGTVWSQISCGLFKARVVYTTEDSSCRCDWEISRFQAGNPPLRNLLLSYTRPISWCGMAVFTYSKLQSWNFAQFSQREGSVLQLSIYHNSCFHPIIEPFGSLILNLTKLIKIAIS